MNDDNAAQRYRAAARIVSQYFVDEDDALLAEACGADADLRAQVDWMIAECRRATGAQFRTPVVAQLDAAPDAVTVPEAREYRVLSPLGFGGMGSVHLAERIDGRARQRVALKIMSAAMADGGHGLAQFHQERAVLAELSHPNIAHLTDGGVLPDGRPFVAMEYIDGTSIDAYCSAHAARVADVVRLMLQVMQAVAYAHRKLIIHRDLKPSNILVTSDGIPKVVDFGIAEFVDETGAARRSGVRSYTPAYASPEQVAGRTLTTATDQYSLGIVLEELLRLCRDVAEVPRELRAVVARATARAEAERYTGVDAFAADLRRYLADQPVDAMGGGIGYRLAKLLWRRRHALGAGLLATLALGAFGYERARQTKVVDREREARLQAADLLVSTLESAGAEVAAGTGGAHRARNAQRTLASISSPSDNESYAVSIGPELIALADRADVEAALREIASIDVADADAERHTGTLLFLSRAYQAAQRFDLARDLAAKALQIERRRATGPSTSLARALGNMANAWSYGPGPQAQHAFALFDEALDTAQHAQPQDPVVLALLHGDYAAALASNDEGFKLNGRMLAQAEAALAGAPGEALPDAARANVVALLALAQWRTGRASAAGRSMDAAWELAQRAYAPGDPRRCRLAVRSTVMFIYWEPKFAPAYDEVTTACGTYLERTADAMLRVESRAISLASNFHPAAPETAQRLARYTARILRLYGPVSQHYAYALYFNAVQARALGDYTTAERALHDALAYFPAGATDDRDFFELVLAIERVQLYRRWPGLRWMASAWASEMHPHPTSLERWYVFETLRIDITAEPAAAVAERLAAIQQRLCERDPANAVEARPYILATLAALDEAVPDVSLYCAPSMSYPPLTAPLPWH